MRPVIDSKSKIHHLLSVIIKMNKSLMHSLSLINYDLFIYKSIKHENTLSLACLRDLMLQAPNILFCATVCNYVFACCKCGLSAFKKNPSFRAPCYMLCNDVKKTTKPVLTPRTGYRLLLLAFLLISYF